MTSQSESEGASEMSKQRNDYLVELLAISKAKSPTFERLLERASQATPPFHDTAGGPNSG